MPRPKITAEQARFWKLWGLYATQQGIKRGDRDARHAAVKEAIGYDKSLGDFSHTDFDIVYAFFLCGINGWNFSREAYLETCVEGSRSRKIYRILFEAPDSYVRSISKARFKTEEWTLLDLRELDQLRITIIERARSLKRRKGVKASLYDYLKPPAPEADGDPF